MKIKYASNLDWIFGEEPSSFLSPIFVKKASSRCVYDNKTFFHVSPKPNQTLLHIIALGAYEGTGFNRNGDCFLEKDCISNHHYFVKAGRAVHREHHNKPSDPKYGNILKSAYNLTLRRIELIIGLDNDKCQDILEEQEKRGYTCWSMACKQEYDICTWCGHKSYTEKDRCEHIPEKLGHINEEGVLCGMVNPNPLWFEISYVRYPADRIGISLNRLLENSETTTISEKFSCKTASSKSHLIYPSSVLIIDIPKYKFALFKNYISKFALIEKHIDAISTESSSKLIEILSKNPLYLLFYAIKNSFLNQDLPSTLFYELKVQLNPYDVLMSLFTKGIILRPYEFLSFITSLPQELLQSFESFMEHYKPTPEDIKNLLVKTSFDQNLMNAKISNYVLQKISPYISKKSLHPDYLLPRFFKLISRKSEITNLKSKIGTYNFPPIFYKYALLYNKYKYIGLFELLQNL